MFQYIKEIHIDTFIDFEPIRTINRLQKLKYHYKVILWEDRKFSDVGSIVSKQLHSGIYQISAWADLISIHASAG